MADYQPGAMRPRMPSIEDIDDEVKTFSGRLEGVKAEMTVAEQRFIAFLNNYEDRVKRIEAMAMRAETLAERTSVSAQEAINRVNQQLQTSTTLMMEMGHTIREVQETQAKALEKQARVWRDIAPLLAPVILIVLEVLHSVGIGAGK